MHVMHGSFCEFSSTELLLEAHHIDGMVRELTAYEFLLELYGLSLNIRRVCSDAGSAPTLPDP